MSSNEVIVDAVLFDMDGTLIESTPAVDRAYESFCKANGLPPTRIPHGVRTIENMRRLLPNASPKELAEKTFAFEASIVTTAQELIAEGKTGLIVLPGTERVLAEIRSSPKAEQHHAICTSATRVYASNALKTSGITPPSHFITAEDVEKGKPHPDPYLLGAKVLSAAPERCLVVEDAPSGIKSGLAAGSIVLALCTSHKREELEQLGAHYLVDNLDSVSFEWVEGDRLKMTVR